MQALIKAISNNLRVPGVDPLTNFQDLCVDSFPSTGPEDYFRCDRNMFANKIINITHTDLKLGH